MQYRLLIQFELEDQTDTLEALLWENAVSTYSNAIWLQIFMLHLNIVFIDFFVVMQNMMRFQHSIKELQLLFLKAKTS